jgi:hypothetical protein
VESVDSPKKRACPHFPQPCDDGDDDDGNFPSWIGDLATLLEEDHNKHRSKWYNFLGELPNLDKPEPNRFDLH